MNCFSRTYAVSLGLACLAALLLFEPACNNAPVGSQPEEQPTVLGSGVDETADQAEVARAIVDEVNDAVPDDDAKIVGALQLQTGPTGSVLGLGLDDDTRLFGLGQIGADGTYELTGAIVEDASGNLIMMQENREDGLKITQATGDAFDLDNSGENPRITVTLNATIPPSTLVIDVDADGNAILNGEESALFAMENPDYNVTGIALARSGDTLKRLPRFKTDPAEECPLVQAIADSVDRFCWAWGLVGGFGVDATAVDQVCAVQQVLLEEVRGSTPVPGLTQDQEFAPKVLAATKLGVELNCQVLKNAVQVGTTIAHPTIPDLMCLVYSIAGETTRLATSDGRNLTQVICDSLVTPEIGIGCSNTCVGADNGRCEDGGPMSMASICLPATDCNDCGARDVPGCANTCATARNNICEDEMGCDIGTDCFDCGGPTPVPGCSDRCDSANDGECDDAGAGSLTSGCAFGTDCTDCGPRDPEDEPEVPQEDCYDEGICNLKCPNFEPDINCTNAELCAGKGFCCVEDGICDITSCNERDPDCTNAHLCSRLSYCCDDDNVCDDEKVEADCPTPDADCLLCGEEDGVCIFLCDPEDPDCEVVDEPDEVTGGCCYDDTLACIGPVSADDCTAEGGVPQESCDPDPCGFACCFPEGNCAEDRSVDACIAEGGTVNDRGTTCATITCDAPPDEWPMVFQGTGTRTLNVEGSFPEGSATSVQSIDVEIRLWENGNVDGSITTPDGEVVEVPMIGGGTSTMIQNSQFIETTCPADASNNAGETVTVITHSFGSARWNGTWSDNGTFEMSFSSVYMPAIISGTHSNISISGSGEWPDPQTSPDGSEFENFICSHYYSTVFSRLSWVFTATRAANTP